MITNEIVERLRYEGESDALDFKSGQYAFVGASDDEKGELLKDLLAFANSWRRSDAYILIGFQEVKGGRAEVQGISSHLDDAALQQFVNSKTQRPLRFAYSSLSIEGKTIAVLHVPLQERPIYLVKKYGKLEANVIYVRRGSSTDQARPDEIAEMGRRAPTQHDVDLDVFFADPQSRKRIEPLVKSLVLEVPPIRTIPDYVLDTGLNPLALSGPSARPDYYRELARFTQVNRLAPPVWVAIENRGASPALDVRLEITVHGNAVRVFDEQSYPDVPRAEFNPADPNFPRAAQHVNPDLYVTRVGDSWVVEGRADKVQPRSTEWFFDPVYVGSDVSEDLECVVKVFADNLRSPHEQVLVLPVQAEREEAGLDRIIELEAERLTSSPGYQELLERYGLDEGSAT